jgi:hypothetical protein
MRLEVVYWLWVHIGIGSQGKGASGAGAAVCPEWPCCVAWAKLLEASWRHSRHAHVNKIGKKKSRLSGGYRANFKV